MSPRRTLVTTARVLRQLRGDPRTIALIMLVPCVLLGLVAWMYHSKPLVIDTVGPYLIGLFPMLVMFLVTSVATLRERASGTLERLMSMPLGRGDFVFGYAGAFAIASAIQALIVMGFAVQVCRMKVPGSLFALTIIAILNAVLGSTLGLAASAWARNEFQAVQMMPAVLFPQMLLSGVLVPRASMPWPLHALSDIFPVSYAMDATEKISRGVGGRFGNVWFDLAVLVGFIILSLIAAVASLRRRSA